MLVHSPYLSFFSSHSLQSTVFQTETFIFAPHKPQVSAPQTTGLRFVNHRITDGKPARYTQKVADMKKLYLAVIVPLLLTACGENESGFRVDGQISGAEGKMLYLDAAALDGIHVLDSVKLKASGDYSFSYQRPEAPDFYRLRLDDRIVNFVIDSTETVGISGSADKFGLDYTIEGSESNRKIKELSLKLADLQGRIDRLTTEYQSGSILPGIYNDSITSMVNSYKNDVKMNYILTAPNTDYAYFALFQRLNGYLLFDPLTDRDDVRCFAAVATSFNNAYPHSERARNLYNIAMKGMRNTRSGSQQVMELPEGSQINESGIIDIALRDIDGRERKLSDLKGKVVLLDFTAYATEVSASHNYMLRELYDKYTASGLEIYQISFDSNEHFWKTTADNLPWVCVRDTRGTYSDLLTLYNVTALPSVFIINRQSELSARPESVDAVESAVKAVL